MKRLIALSAALATCIHLSAPAPVSALPGDLDLGFGGFGVDGKIQDLGFNANAMVIDIHGRIVMAGRSGDMLHVQRRSGPRFLTVKNRTYPELGVARANAVAMAPDGKIVVAGEVTGTGGGSDFAIVRLNADLTPDLTFAGDGFESSNFHGLDDRAFGVAVQSDKKIVVVGEVETEQGNGFSYSKWGAERFNEDGTRDDGFDGDGRWTFGDEDLYVGARAVLLPGDGKILIGGTICNTVLCDKSFGIVRLNANGSADTSFGEAGVSDTGFGEDQELNSLALAPDGKIVALGNSKLTRYLSDGTLDDSFGIGGRVEASVHPPGQDFSNRLIVQPDRKIVISSFEFVDGPDPFHLVRFAEDGSFDTTFGDGGRVATVFGPTQARPRSLVLQSDGLLVLAGAAQAARYRWDGSLDAGGRMDVVFDPNHVTSTATALSVQPDGKLVAAGQVYHASADGSSSYDMAITRFTRDRHGLDATFGSDSPRLGRTLYGVAGEDEIIRAMASRADNETVVTGTVSSSLNGSGILAGRFNADGAPDSRCVGTGFNNVVVGNVDGFGRSADGGSAIAVGLDDKFYVAGTVRGPLNSDYGLARLAENCTVDRADGLQLENYNFRLDLGAVENLGGAVLQGTDVVMAGTSGDDILLVRFGLDRSMNMALDRTFGSDGRAILDTGFDTRVTGLHTQSDGKLIVSGWLNRGGGTGLDADFLVARFTARGERDSTFGDDGVALANFGPFDVAYGAAVRSDDTIALAGCTNTGVERLAVAQFTADGQLDTRFRGTGKATLRLGADADDCARAVTFLGSNHLVVGGYSTVFGKPQFALASLETTQVRGVPIACVGDCESDGLVTVDELIVLVNIAIGTTPVSSCAAGHQDGQVELDEIVSAVSAALTAC